MNLTEHLKSIDVCVEARDWIKAEEISTAQDAWTRCERGDWLLWWWGKVDAGKPWADKRRPLVGAAMECAALALPIFEARHPDDHRVRACIDGFKRWARGEEVPHGELKRLQRGCFAAAAAADAAYAAYAAADATYAYAAAADVAAAYAAARARLETLNTCAEIVRRWRSTPPWREES